MRDGHHHLLFLNQILDLDLCFVLDDFRASILSVCLANFFEFIDDDLHEQVLVGENGTQPRNQITQLAILFRQLLLLEPRETTKAHLQDGFCLALAKAIVGAVSGTLDLRLRTSCPPHEFLEALQWQGHQAGSRFIGIATAANGLDHDVSVRGHHA